ncbi:MAG: glycine oxidase ThiO [Gemmatimonadales bacterium]|nr:MAG: glycine oxidase ThiO [Gemmatimonadales bacterium]
MREEPAVLVIGGGVVGLAAAWALSDAGLRPRVVDPGEITDRATWAAGGMLAPMGEAREPGPFLHLALSGLERYPAFVRRLEAASGIGVGLHLDGKLLTATRPDDLRKLEARRDWLLADGHPVEWMDGEDARRLEPSLSPHVRAGLLLEGNGRVHNRDLQRALETAVAVSGVATTRGRVSALRSRGGRVEGVTLRDGRTLDAPVVVLAAGAWSGGIEGLPRPLPVRPVKGQMLAIASPDRPLCRVVTSPDVYLIPREAPEGPQVLVGATSEEAGFDRSLEPRGQAALEDGARDLVPQLGDAPVVERWTGLRPGTPDDLPIVGPDPEVSGLWYLTGHYRNGILLAPATAHLLTEGLTGVASPPAAFRVERFSDPVLVRGSGRS